jgi:hypothetical protein
MACNLLKLIKKRALGVVLDGGQMAEEAVLFEKIPDIEKVTSQQDYFRKVPLNPFYET